MARQYNFIYSKLVRDEDDFVGHIAYALYKAEKVAYIEKFKSEHGGQEPTEEDLKPKYSCNKCNDTGYLPNGKMCDCYVGNL